LDLGCACDDVQVDDSEVRRSHEGRLSVLLEEYRALRAETAGRISSGMTLVGFVAAGIGLVVSVHGNISWVVALLLGVFVLIVWLSNLWMVGRLGKRLSRIEREINRSARIAYHLSDTDQLMNWERDLAASPGWLRAAADKLHIFRAQDRNVGR
jgi:hypothetical protein